MKLPWMPFYAADWMTDEAVRLMTLEQQGAYFRLLCSQWVEGSIPADTSAIAWLLGLNPNAFPPWSNLLDEWRLAESGRALDAEPPEGLTEGRWWRHVDEHLWPVLAPQFHPVPGTPGRLVNRRLASIRREQVVLLEARREGGRRGGKGEKSSRPQELGSSLVTKPSPSPAQAQPKPSPSLPGGDGDVDEMKKSETGGPSKAHPVSQSASSPTAPSARSPPRGGGFAAGAGEPEGSGRSGGRGGSTGGRGSAGARETKPERGDLVDVRDLCPDIQAKLLSAAARAERAATRRRVLGDPDAGKDAGGDA
jgi:hypothetical protein